MVYDVGSNSISHVYGVNGTLLQMAYDVNGNQLLETSIGKSGGGEEDRSRPFTKTTLPYSMNWLINNAWLTNAATQRDAILAIYNHSEDAIPFFIQSDGHGKYNECNVGCHNLAESTMRYIRNIQLGDYESNYYNGTSAQHHLQSSQGLVNYTPVMGNHEFSRGGTDPDAEYPDYSVIIPAFTPKGADIDPSYGYYKIVDAHYSVKYLVGQPHIIDLNNSDGFVYGYTSEQWDWFIEELEANDGYDIVVLNHEPFGGTYTKIADSSSVTGTGGAFNLTPILQARKAKTAGSYTDTKGATHTYDFTGCTSDLLCVFHGHVHAREYIDKTQLGYPVYVERDVTTSGADCSYGIIDRDGGKLYIYPVTKNAVGEALVLDL